MRTEYNPAALLEGDKREVSAGINYLRVNADHTSPSGVMTDNQQSDFLLPSVYYKQQLSSAWAIGVGVNTPFGLASEYEKSAPFSYITTGGEINLVNISPNVAYQVTKSISIGAGVNYYQSTAKLTQQAPWSFPSTGNPDGELKVEGSGTGVGVNSGVLWKINDNQRFGATYKSEVKVKYSGKDASIENVPFLGGATYKTGVETSIRFPDILSMGYGFKPTEKLEIEIGGQWTNWTDVEKLTITFDQPTAFLPNNTQRLDWKNSWVGRVGGTYQMNPTWSLAGGYFYDSTPTRESTYTPLVADGDHHVFSLGAMYKSGGFSVGIPAVLILQTGTSHIDNDITDITTTQNVDGKYNLLGYQLGLGVKWAF
ncbi:MAG: outer membrane protein transport protein [Elusimicrobia bacterium]|nr:outer membrane protein transport protein [Elusimicrobiota bacterium]